KNISKRKLYPVIKVEANALFWNDNLAINFTLPEDIPLDIDMDPIMVREQFTMQTTVTVAQPVTPWFSLKSLYDLDKVEVEAKNHEFEMDRDKVEAKVREAFYNAFKARSYLEITEDAQEMLLKQKKRVEALVKYEYATSADLARVESALADINAQKIKVTASIQLAKQFLAYILGIEINSSLQLIATPPNDIEVISPARCIKMAMQSNPVFKMLKKREEQVELAKKALKWDKYPRVMAVAQYKNSLGFGEFEPMNQGFFGFMVSWKFKWFNRWREEDRINLKNQRIQLNLQKAKRGLSLEIYNNYTKVQNSLALINSRQASLKAAKAAYRKVENLKKHQYSTVSDLLEARTQLTKARVKLANAKYDLGLQFFQYQALCK
ncbi:MAG: TolC family protein, partial [Myxococcota bacterium]